MGREQVCDEGLKHIYFRFRSEPAWLTRISAVLGLTEAEERFLEDIDAGYAALEKEWRRQKHEIPSVDPVWANERRLEYLRSEVRRLSMNKYRAFISVNDEIRLEKFKREIMWREEPKTGKSINERDIMLAKAVPIFHLLGKNIGDKVLCPWHEDKRPSFHLYADGKGYCFSCKKTATAIDWLMQIRGLSFVMAVKRLF